MCNVVAEEVKLASISPMPSVSRSIREALPPIPEVQKEI